MHSRVAPLLLGLMAASVVPAQAQLRASRPPRPVQNLPRLMVANPHSFDAKDSAAAVRVGSGMREKMEDVADRWYQVIARNQMNDALVQYGYPPDAVLPPLVARQLASQLQARAYVTSTLARGDGGRVTVEARVLGISDQSGYIVKMGQDPNQSFEDLGKKLADGLRGAFGALPEAKKCAEQMAADPKKAAESAQKALKEQPDFAPADICLAQMAIARKAPADEIIGYFKSAVKGDRLSLEAWGGLLGQYQQQGDTAQIVNTYTEILRVAPTNQDVREQALKYFIAAGKPELGEQIAREGIQNDAQNPDLYDLLATALLLQEKPEKNKEALEALQHVVQLDSTKADSTFYYKATFIASREPVDTAAYVRWAQMGVKKYPNNATLLGELVKAYGFAGPVDSLVAVTKRLVAVDTTDVTPVLRAVRALLAAKRYQEGMELGSYIERYGSDDDKRNLGVVLAQEGGLEILKTQPVDFALATDVGRKATSLVSPGTREHQLASYVLGIGLMGGITAKHQAVIDTKSCEAIDSLEAWVNATKEALTNGQPINPDFVTQRITQINDTYNKLLPQMRKAYCKKD